MFELIEKLRSKPESAKKRIAFFTAFAFSGLLFIAWATVIFPNFKRSLDQTAKDTGPSPISTFAATIMSGVSSVTNQISEIKTVSGSFSKYLTGGVASTTIATSTQANPATTTEATKTNEATTTGIFTGE